MAAPGSLIMNHLPTAAESFDVACVRTAMAADWLQEASFLLQLVNRGELPDKVNKAHLRDAATLFRMVGERVQSITETLEQTHPSHTWRAS